MLRCVEPQMSSSSRGCAILSVLYMERKAHKGDEGGSYNPKALRIVWWLPQLAASVFFQGASMGRILLTKPLPMGEDPSGQLLL